MGFGRISGMRYDNLTSVYADKLQNLGTYDMIWLKEAALIYVEVTFRSMICKLRLIMNHRPATRLFLNQAEHPIRFQNKKHIPGRGSRKLSCPLIRYATIRNTQRSGKRVSWIRHYQSRNEHTTFVKKRHQV